MNAGGVSHVQIEPVEGELATITTRLTRSCGSHPRFTAGVARGRRNRPHEAGHAIQDATHYPGLVVRNFIVPLASIGSTVCWLPVMAGLMIGMTKLVFLGIILFSLTVVFQVINLPVEFNASRRGREMLRSTGVISPEEDRTVGKVLNAAAWTYVAGVLTGVLTLLYYLGKYGALNCQRRS